MPRLIRLLVLFNLTLESWNNLLLPPSAFYLLSDFSIFPKSPNYKFIPTASLSSSSKSIQLRIIFAKFPNLFIINYRGINFSDMEKLLAMSILSSTPSEIKSGISLSWMNMSFRKKSSQESKNNDSKSERSELKKKKEEQQQKNSKGMRAAWFAPEFDGLNCYETIVSH